jgi:hypothetical protein
MRELMMKLKHAVMGLLVSMSPPPEMPFAQSLLGSYQGAAWHKAFNGCQPQVKQAQRQAKARRATRRARRLGHA